MAPPTLSPPSSSSSSAPSSTITLEPLTPSSFSPFGTAICSPLPPSLNKVPSSIPLPQHSPYQPTPVYANQNSALKTSPISQFINAYPAGPDSKSRPANPQMSMFSCFPRNISGVGMDVEAAAAARPIGPRFHVSILERHPFTTQTFSPLGLAADDKSTVFLVIVAPSLVDSKAPATRTDTNTNQTVQISNPPDLSRLRAFLARGDQAVTYAPGTWHAPMVVLGQKRVDFLVSQFVNGVPDDDCQEVLLGDNAVYVDLAPLKSDLGIVAKSKL
ncbi:hypothetical protein ABEF95_004463 [Exophiala dermatitidis]